MVLLNSAHCTSPLEITEILKPCKFRHNILSEGNPPRTQAYSLNLF